MGAPPTMARSSGEKIVLGMAAARSLRAETDLRLTLIRPRPTSAISASTSVGADSPETSARTIALAGVASVVPVRTSASVGAPRKERRVLRYTIASSTLVFPVPFSPVMTVVPSAWRSSAAAEKMRKSASSRWRMLTAARGTGSRQDTRTGIKR